MPAIEKRPTALEGRKQQALGSAHWVCQDPVNMETEAPGCVLCHQCFALVKKHEVAGSEAVKAASSEKDEPIYPIL